jgi:hypothetical protein
MVLLFILYILNKSVDSRCKVCGSLNINQNTSVLFSRGLFSRLAYKITCCLSNVFCITNPSGQLFSILVDKWKIWSGPISTCLVYMVSILFPILFFPFVFSYAFLQRCIKYCDCLYRQILQRQSPGSSLKAGITNLLTPQFSMPQSHKTIS